MFWIGFVVGVVATIAFFYIPVIADYIGEKSLEREQRSRS